ncbi:serine--tRNA ligase [Candidatus Falkowbacteria bacterium HGW-Falkowbacteria-2]|uniref:Serine--tRNA ligase n=1 Tax=Candidatus Falkowbacteria bacterium HGW-Falkowbacteria-2 TaxID=2013769 RepID=A0A2N2E2G0_9BACT|nr:MAG: serine--tRNA ligase [Candidatus Falkowbacteria bacterium HGW-Falkowbacteria-2]
MLDIKYIRENQETVVAALSKRMDKKKIGLKELLKLDDDRRNLIKEVETLKAVRNQSSKTKPSPETIAAMKTVGEQIKALEESLKGLEEEIQEKISALPNLPADDVVAGGKENNEVIYTFGEKPSVTFEQKDHVELAESLGVIDYVRAAKMSGSGFWCYRGMGALLEWALISYFIAYHNKNGYQFLIPPFLLSEKSAYTSGHLPKFRDELFWTQDKLCLNATSEMMLGNYHREEILPTERLPLKYFAYSPCFRREAGSYRQEERGMVRGHQFNKVEMFIFCKAEDSWKMFDELVENAKGLVEGLGLHYQVSKLAAGDCSAAMAKTYDLEIWLPSMGIYKEVSSISNALDYQARRGQTRYKNEKGENVFVHTLNASGLATSRLLPAILEQNQLEDGSVRIPEALRSYIPGAPEFIYPDNNLI